MTDPDAWHYVRPIGGPAMTVMVTGRPWDRDAPRSTEPLRQLDQVRFDEILAFFVEVYR